MIKAKIIQKRREANFLFYYKLMLPYENFVEYKIPGQYGIFDEGGQKIFLAFANAPYPVQKEPYLELLIREGSGVSSQFLNLKESDDIFLLEIAGKGFPIHFIKNEMIHLFSMGSGISAIRSLILYLMGLLDFSMERLYLWQSSFSEKYLPFTDDFKKWEKLFTVYYCYDQQEPFENVIDKIKLIKPDFSNSLQFWIGSAKYGRDIWEIGKNYGMKPESFHTNYDFHL